MSTPASVKGHPIHPMLVALPIGLWVFSIVCDIVFHAGWGRPTWKVVAWYTIAGGVVGALLSAVPGFIDFLSIRDRRVGRIGLVHMVLNLIAVALFAVSFGLRIPHPLDALPVVLSGLGIVAILISGWLGGELVYVHRMGVNKPPR
jgi:uncharacterized membrane protein